MANNRHKPEEIVTKRRQVEVLVGQGMARIDAIREVRIWLSPDRSIAEGCRLAGERQADRARVARREGLKVPSKQPKKGRLWLNDGSGAIE